jgi:pyruvate ferredoxin oxidoreductase beta subunit
MQELKTFRDIGSENFVTGGHNLCSGCGPSIGLRLALLALGKKTIVLNSAGCLTLMPTFPFTQFKVPWIFLAIENGGASAIGIRNALKALKRDKDTTILAFIGDGATYDIGFQSLSHLFERDDRVIYVCYNNQNFANTGHQMNSATSKKAKTTTTPKGNPFWRKPMTKIAAAHGIKYCATATVGFELDFMNKLKKAQKVDGATFIDLLCPCQPGWGHDPSITIKLSKLAVETGAWPLYEIENGNFALNHKPTKLKPMKEYLELQQRFKHLTPKEIKEIQSWVSEEWNQISKGNFWEAKEY